MDTPNDRTDALAELTHLVAEVRREVAELLEITRLAADVQREIAELRPLIEQWLADHPETAGQPAGRR